MQTKVNSLRTYRRRYPNRAPAPKRCRSGIALVWSAVVLGVMVLMLGLSIDWGKIAWNVHQLQNAADAGALAGAQLVKYDQAGAIQLAHDIAFENVADQLPVDAATTPQTNPLSGNEEIILGRWVRQERRFYPTTAGANAVKVIAKRQEALGARAPALNLLFGHMAGVDTVDADRYATAWSRLSSGAGIICLADDPSVYPDWRDGDTEMRASGKFIIDVRGVDAWTKAPIIGDIQVNGASMSLNEPALSVDGEAGEIWAGEINVVGWADPVPDTSSWQSLYGDPAAPFSVNPEAPTMIDPLVDVAPPDVSTMPVPITATIDRGMVAAAGGELTLERGYYPGGIDLTGGGTIVLPGGPDAVYAFAGAGLAFNGGALIGDGVMVYVTGDPDGSKTGVPTPNGEIRLRGNPQIELTSRGDAGYLPNLSGGDGIALWQDRDNDRMATILGTPGSFIQGVIYCGYNPMEVGGNAAQMGTQLIAGALRSHGNLTLRIAYDGRNAVVARLSVLVE
ncbi:MAG: pilus assembly protein [Phycisphaerales bacterium]|nr:MAG: pilus assembly protein [Phycisphaerales bacterium]